jgi:sialic acid synthase SpsE
LKSSLQHFKQNKPFIILDIGTNPMGDPILADRMVRAAAQTGALVKFQAYRVSELLHPNHPAYSMLLLEETPSSLLSQMIDLTQSLSAPCGITVFSPEGIRLAKEKKVDFIKIASGDITYHLLIKMAAETGIPLILSTGCADQKDVDSALKVARIAGAKLLALLHCVSLYPAPIEASNLAVMDNWLKLALPAGFSDHSLGIEASQAALALGAVALERHFTVDPKLPGGDNDISITETEAKRLMDFANYPHSEKMDISSVNKTPLWGKIPKRILKGEDPLVLRRHLVAKHPLKKGQKVRTDDFLYLRVGRNLCGPPIGADVDLTNSELTRDLDLMEILKTGDLRPVNPNTHFGGV